MCGLAGTVNLSGTLNLDINKKRFDKAYKYLKVRGPDDTGVWYDKNTFFLHTRLKIIDLKKTSAQPMEIGNYIICYNGEIYNFKKIKKLLLKKGYHFKSSGDTEVLLKAWIEWKEKAMEKLDGMFAFSIWDKKEKTLFLARDRFGKKPLIYCNKNNSFSFASDIMSLRQLQDGGEISQEAIKSLFRFRYIYEPLTIFENFRKLPPGNFLIYNKYGMKVSKYYDLSKKCKGDLYNKYTVEKDITNLMLKSVEKRLGVDVPLGVFLSGGIDSGLILTTLAKLGKKIPCFTIGFSDENNYYNEIESASFLAKYLGFKHNKIMLNSKKVIHSIEKILDTSDEPFADSSAIPMYLVSEQSSKYIKVALTGDGGDEIFGGYRKYIAYRWKKTLELVPYNIRFLLAKNLSDSKNSKIKDLGRKLKRLLLNTDKDYKLMQINFLDQLSINEYFLLFGVYDKTVIDNKLYTDADYSDAINLVLARDMQLSLLSDMLVKLDRYSMANSLEVRSPFLDKELVEYAFSIPGKNKVGYFSGKTILKNHLSSFFPDNYMKLPKKGFEVPLDKWLKKDLKHLVESSTKKKVTDSLNINDPSIINSWKKEFFNGKKDHAWKLWTLITYSAWANNNNII